MDISLYENLLLSFSNKYNTLSHMFVLWSNFVFDSHYFPEMLSLFFFFLKSPEAIYQNDFFFFFLRKFPLERRK